MEGWCAEGCPCQILVAGDVHFDKFWCPLSGQSEQHLGFGVGVTGVLITGLVPNTIASCVTSGELLNQSEPQVFFFTSISGTRVLPISAVVKMRQVKGNEVHGSQWVLKTEIPALFYLKSFLKLIFIVCS